MILRSITRTVSIEAPTEKVFSFLADAANWPSWSIINVLSVSPAESDWWHMKTPGGMAKLRIRPNAELGILDHDFNAPEAQWSVPALVVQNGTGTLFMITFFQPPTFTDAFFDEQVLLVDKELAKLKEIMEHA
jgi:uncharacterized protein YndB with AHSA1/START domain